MKKVSLLFVLFSILILTNSCTKKDSTTDSSNLKVNVSIPSTGFEYQGKVVVRVVDIANTSLIYSDSTDNGGTVSFKLNNGGYSVYSYAPHSTNANKEGVSSNYGSYGSQDVTISSSLSTLSFTKWCQSDLTAHTQYCN